MQPDGVLQVVPEPTASANMLTGSVTAQYAATLPAQPAQAAAATAAGAAHAASMWAPSVAANLTTRQQVLAAVSVVAPRGGALAQRNDQALTEVVETDDQNTKDLTPHPVVTV